MLDAIKLERPGSNFALQLRKLRVYDLKGRRGRDFISTIERDVRLISSERRELISRDGLETESPLRGILIGNEERTPVQVLRDVDRLKVERYAASVAIGKVDDVTKFVALQDASAWCRKQLRPLAEALTDAEHWIDFFDTACRALGVAIRAGDTQTSRSILERLDLQLETIRAPRRGLLLFWNGRRATGPRAGQAVLRWFDVRLQQELCSSLSAECLGSIARVAAELAQICGPVFLRKYGFSAAAVRAGALALQAADLRHQDRESDFKRGRLRATYRRPEAWSQLEDAFVGDKHSASRARRIRSFLHVCRKLKDHTFDGMSVIDMILMTRPPSAFDIGYRWARAAMPVSTLINTINAIRGTRYRASTVTSLSEVTVAVGPPSVVAGAGQGVTLVLGNLMTQCSWLWAASDGVPVLSSNRLTSLAKIVNRAIRVKRDNGNKEVLLLLPELSVPREWIRLVAEHLITENVSLVTGLEYHRRARSVSNEAIGVFAPGFSLGAVCVWRKAKPARDEERNLLARGVQFRRYPVEAPLSVQIGGMTISTLICSELLEAERRSALMGRIDLLLVPSWNRDTATFDHTIQTTANDVHCYVAIANVAQYSDCRVHCPSDERFRRDVCRLICRTHDEAISTRVDVRSLQTFQRVSADPSAEPKGFKPVPPGFRYRRV